MDAVIAQSPSRFDMFGLDLGYLGFSRDITFTIVTNPFTYVFTGITAPVASQSMDFYGFLAGAGEYFTGFNLAAAGGSGSAPVIDNVTLGQTGQPPSQSRPTSSSWARDSSASPLPAAAGTAGTTGPDRPL